MPFIISSELPLGVLEKSKTKAILAEPKSNCNRKNHFSVIYLTYVRAKRCQKRCRENDRWPDFY